MREELIRHYAPQLDIVQFRPRTGRGWLEAACPLAPWTHEKGHDAHPSFAIRVNEAGKSAFVCQSCKRKGTFANLAFMLYGFTQDKKYQDLGFAIENDESASAAAALPEWDDEAEDEVSPVFLNRAREFARYPEAITIPRCIKYCEKRGITPFTMIRLGLRFHPKEDRLLFPVFDHNQELRGFTGRAMYPKPKMKVKDFAGLRKRELMLGEHRVARDRHKFRFVVVVEGPFDYAKVMQAGFPCVALLGSQLTPEKFDRLIAFDLPIIWMTDNDDAGMDCLLGLMDPTTGEREAQRGALHRLDPYLPQLLVEYPENGGTDPGSLSEAQIAEMIDSAKLWQLSDAA